MNRAAPGTIAIVWRGDRTTRREATPQNNRFHRIFAELAILGLRAEPAVYDETFADEVRAQLLRAEGVLVWVNPLQDGKTRYSLDTMLREVAAHGPWVSAHPDTILRMGTKEVLVRTRHLGWGTDTQLYESMAQLRDALTAQLAAGRARVLKQNRGNDGQGVWKVEPVASRGGSMVRITEAAQDGPAEEVPLEAFLARCEPYFERGGTLIDQPFQERVVDGMIRCYMAADRVAGFAHQYPKGLLPPLHVRPHAEKRMYPREVEAFQPVRAKMENEWTPQMIAAVDLEAAALPVIWDADFFYGAKTASGSDTYVLCELNVSSVFAIPEQASAAIAREVAQRLGASAGTATRSL